METSMELYFEQIPCAHGHSEEFFVDTRNDFVTLYLDARHEKEGSRLVFFTKDDALALTEAILKAVEYITPPEPCGKCESTEHTTDFCDK